MFRHLTAIWTARYFLFALVKLDLRLRYRRSVLGVGWSLMHPIAMTAVFTIVFGHLFGESNPIEYAAFALSGMAVFSFLRDAATVGSKSFFQSEGYIRQSPLPYTIYTLRSVLGHLIHACLALVVVVGLMTVWRGNPGPLVGLALAIPGLLLTIIAAWAIATIGAFVTAFFHDMAHLLEVAAQIGFFLTPIMYRRSLLDSKGLGWVVDINPANMYLNVTRDPLLAGMPTTEGLAQLGHAYVAALVVTAMLVGLATGVVAWLHKKVIFHL